MIRQRYETVANKSDEARAVNVLRSIGYIVCQFGPLSPCDFFISKANTLYLAEFKRRTNAVGQYPDVMIPEKKLRTCLTMAEQLNIQFLYIVEFTDGLYCAVVKDYRTAIGGRTDRGDPRDITRVAYIPTKDFTRIG